MTVIWNATDKIVGRNARKVLVNVACNVTVNYSVSRLAKKMNAI